MWKIANKTIQGKTILAPLAGVGDSVFRRINRRYGAGLIYTEFISALGLLHKNKKTFKMIDLAESESPVTIQLFGREPEDLAEACKYIEQTGADFVDLNCGCPEPKIVKSGAGSALLSDPDRIARIVSAMVKSVTIPITVKIRMGLTQDKPIYLELAKMVEDAGANALAINCCFASQQKKGPYQWEILNELVNELNIPVIGNGGIDTPEDAVEVMKTGVSAVMIGRASLGNPWIFREINSALAGEPIPSRPTIEERFSVMADHLREEVKLLGDYFGVAVMRKHWAWYVKGLPGASSFRGQAVRAGTISEMLGLLNEFRDYLSTKN